MSCTRLHGKSVNASLCIVYMVEAGGTPVESPVVITGLCMALRGLLRGDTGRITGVCSDQMMLKSIAGSGAARGNLDLTVNGGEMPTDGAGTDHQLFCYLGIGKSLCHQAQYLDLSCRQAAGIGG
jgi:hypothetical protein